MKVVYDPEVDVLSVLLSDTPVAESDQDKPGVILDYYASGNMVSFEIVDASKRMANPCPLSTPLRSHSAVRHEGTSVTSSCSCKRSNSGLVLPQQATES